MSMKMEEEFEGDRILEIETDDEENEAERDCDDDTESDMNDNSSRRPSFDNIVQNSLSWPQSYRKSMDMYSSLTPQSTSFLTRSGSYKMSQSSMADSHLTRPLLITERIEVPDSTLPIKFSDATGSKFSVDDSHPPEKCSLFQSLLNATNSLCGIGILSTPYALKEGGWYSLLILIILGIITCYTGILLQRCLESTPGLQTYPDIGQSSFGLAGRICMAIVLYLELYSSCVEYLIMMSDNLASMFPNANMDFGGLHLDSYTLCTIISTLLILPTVWLRDLSLLSYVSAGGVVTLFVVVLCLLWVGTVDGVGFDPSGSPLNLAKLPVTIGLYSFCYRSHSVFPSIYSSMKEPSKFPFVLVIR
ncbi:hypothetical protein LIER_39723 [Lithospermum erythrorhizon]|uniref:Amino acid transporter transmembrane domain-containing protein n=1 Tax=Lithospermum erythrorhizon TaxID=34254 RepID=A0AAV3QM72_LITER